ncbi:MAG: MOSC N-terminal beta barrel domain-containing protein [Actinomycetota bacterium]
MRVEQLWTYPVKSMIGTPVEGIELGTLGVVGDRYWAVRDLRRGGIRGAKKLGGLMRIAARATADGAAEVVFPDGRTVRVDSPDVHAWISAELGHPVRLEPLAPADDGDHYRRGAPDSDDMMDELRSIFGREGDEPLPDLSVFPETIIENESPPGTHYDAFPLLVMTTTALESLRGALPDSAIDVRRFRPSIVVDGAGDDGHPEFEWAGRRARLGGAEIEFTVPCPRCVMITREIDGDVPVDRGVLRYVVRELDQNVGIYATVTQPGTVAAGDTIELVA